jgi:hypothetical protein
MTREDLFRAVGEVREDQITDAETAQKKKSPWRRYAALAACLAVVVLAGFAVSRLGGSNDIAAQQAELTDNGSDVDGTQYSTDAAAQTQYSTGVEFGELAWDGSSESNRTEGGSSASLAWMEPMEIFARDTVIFRGTVRNLRYFVVESDTTTISRTVVTVEVTDCVRGGLGVGDIYNILLPCGPGYSNSLVGNLEKLKVGSDAVFMPFRTTQDTGEDVGSGYFCYADLAELYFTEGIRYLFLDTEDGLSFERAVYADIADAETLDEVVNYLRETVPDAAQPPETAAEQPAQVPVEPQADPADNAQEEPGSAEDDPSGARELPDDAVSGNG